MLHSRESGALLSSNDFGRDIYDALRARLNLPEIADEIARQNGFERSDVEPLVSDVVQQWQAAGLFLQDMCPFVDPVPYRVPVTDISHTYCFGNRYVVLRCENPKLSKQVAACLRIYAAGPLSSPDDGETALLDVIAEDGEYGVFRDRVPVWGRAPHDLTRYHIIRECMDHICTPARVAAHLHAAAVAQGGQALILAGGSGQGKTTLSLGLLASGCQQAADDHVAVAVDGTNMLAFPAVSSVKRGAWNLPWVQSLDPGGSAETASPRNGVRFVRPPRTVPAATPLPVSAFVFPDYAEGAENSCSLLDPAQALTQLIQTGGRVSRRNPSLAPLVALLDRVPSYYLRYGSTDYSVETCQSLLAR